MMRWRTTVWAGLTGISLASCASDGGEASATIEPKLTAIQAEIFDGSCALSSCHSTKAHAGSLVLEAGKARAQLVGVLAAQAKAKAEGLLRVKAGDSAQSFLLQKCAPGLAADYGAAMPIGEDGLPAAQRAALEGWIAAGALDD